MSRGWPLVAVLAMTVSTSVSAQRPRFTPPRLLSADLPPLPAPNVAGGGEVLIEFIVDQRGAVTRPVIVRSTPPYTQMVLDVLSRWQFEPARALDERGVDETVQAPMTVAALYRPPVLLNAPTTGQPPVDVVTLSRDVGYPVTMVMPSYPPQAFSGGVILYDVALDDAGRMVGARGVSSMAGFESAARDALAQMRFRGATYRARPVASSTYVLFGFRPPVVSPSQAPRPQR